MPVDCYDPLDPNGSITVTFDIHEWRTDGYLARVLIFPSSFSRLGSKSKTTISTGMLTNQDGTWGDWTKNEIIWSMSGAFATAQGDCSAFKYQTPHSCQPKPVIADLMPDALPANKSEDCCHGGLLSAWAIDPSKSFSSFEITVGNLDISATVPPPANLTLSAPGPGYTCGPVMETDPTQSSDIGGRRKVQVYSKYPMQGASRANFYSNKNCQQILTWFS
ncbi:hypothetical protein GH714_030949 [Hevea brasiliensis]|uniref:COBRA-like protein n=1 Tax=Hevea brasiliensis TaxID=3981 RepID=A0A6A6NAZ8_HEVBR|nr:hypothetical protein GH714_030949 [Hevea brasiliensis]